MKGGINKIFRKVAATSGKSDYDKVILCPVHPNSVSSKLPTTWTPKSPRRSTSSVSTHPLPFDSASNSNFCSSDGVPPRHQPRDRVH